MNMIQAKHTPRPWSYQPPHGAFGHEVHDGKGELICQMNHHPRRQVQAKVDATLIIAAPELLEACEYTIDQLRNVKGKTFPIMPILNAIRKAKGETL